MENEPKVFRKHIVCRGNAERSPVAKWIFEQEAAKRGLKADITTSGLNAEEGMGATSGANYALTSLGYDPITDHCARRFDPRAPEVLEARYILCFTKLELGEIAGLVFNENKGRITDPALFCLRYRVCTLPVKAGFPHTDIPDPNSLTRGNFYTWLVNKYVTWTAARRFFYRLGGGMVDPGDTELVNEVHLNTARKIQFYVIKIVEQESDSGKQIK